VKRCRSTLGVILAQRASAPRHEIGLQVTATVSEEFTNALARSVARRSGLGAPSYGLDVLPRRQANANDPLGSIVEEQFDHTYRSQSRGRLPRPSAHGDLSRISSTPSSRRLDRLTRECAPMIDLPPKLGCELEP
jgi:hypothetical protein